MPRGIRRITSSIAFLLIGLALVAACDWRQQAPPASAPPTIRIGAVLPLTGALAPYGKWVQGGLEIARDELNATRPSSAPKFELIVEDSLSTPKDAVSALRKLVSADRVPVIIGFLASGEAMAAAPVANETKTVIISPSAATPDLTTAGDYVFRTRLSGTAEINSMVRYARDTLGMSSVAIIYINNDYGTSFTKLFEQEFQRLGGRIAFSDGFEAGATDFRGQLDKIARATSLDGVYLPVHAREGATLLKQARELGIRTRMLSSIGIVSPDLFSIAGDAADGLVYSEPAYEPEAMGHETERFDKLYFQRFGTSSEQNAANAYDALLMLALAIDKGGYTSDGIKQELYRIRDFPGAGGRTSFDENGDVSKPVVIREIRGGVPAVLATSGS